MNHKLQGVNWSEQARRALSATEIVSHLAQLEGWALAGDGPSVAIEKTYAFENYYETMAFVNAIAFIAHVTDHHPDLWVGYKQCVVRWSTHDVSGISKTDFECAARIDALRA